MADTRTLEQKLAAMAADEGSPNEAAIAAAKLQEMGAGGRVPPRVPVASRMADWGEDAASNWVGGFTTSTGSASGFVVRWTVRTGN